jgi:hypothetical protein
MRRVVDSLASGPNEISIADPEAVKAIYGSQAPVTKGPWYTLLEPRVPLFMARDKQEHARRRKVWDQAFTTKGRHPFLCCFHCPSLTISHSTPGL